jgi:hypothetical protein
MPDYILLMHDDSLMHDDNVADYPAWAPYIQRLQQGGVFQGGSAIGHGVSLRKVGTAAPVTVHLAGFIRVHADSLDQAKSLLAGNPVFEAGGTVEIRELPPTD